MRIVFIPFLAISLLHVVATGQTTRVPSNALFRKLSGSRGVVQNIQIPRYEVFLPSAAARPETWTGSILHDGRSLYILPNGTGQVFAATALLGDSISFTRIDSTIFRGYNNHSFEFIHRDTLFSFGGYGFWRINGHLRYFRPGGEWGLAPLKAEQPGHGRFAYYDSSQGSVYLIQAPWTDEATGKRHDRHLALQIDLRARDSRILGSLTPASGAIKGRMLLGAAALGGILVDDHRSIRLLDFKGNRVLILRNRQVADWIAANSGTSREIRFEAGGRLFRYDRSTDRLDSMTVSRGDFEATGERLFIPEGGSASVGLLMLSLAGVVVVFAVGISHGRTRPPRGDSPVMDHAAAPTPTGITESAPAFDGVEMQLIERIIGCQQSGGHFQAEDVNHALGVAKKSVEVQKKMRREVINRINQRFREMTGGEDDLIVSARSEEDRRYYRYRILPEALARYRQIGIRRGL